MEASSNRHLICALLLLLGVCVYGENLRKLSVSDWWEKAAFYQIYPRSFKDSDGDGIGDLNGITEKLPYLKALGVKSFWLSPIYKSPMADFGYDIADFLAIQPEYGTMEDFEKLVKAAKAHDLKLILDFVPNHSSDEHEWFVKSENSVSGYEDYYVWHDGVPGTNPNQNDPPNNWNEAFHGSAWKWSTIRKQYYLHQFHVKQPDLNYRNPAVVEEMKNVLRFWLDKGVDGFRVDAVPWLFEDPQLRNEPPSGWPDDPLRPEYLSHIYTQDLPEASDMVYQWREVMDAYTVTQRGHTRVLMTEAWSNLTIISTYFQDKNGRKGSQMPFNFQLILNLDHTSNAADFKTVIDSWLDTVPTGHAPNWVLGNHDRRRVASRMGGEHMADIMALVELSMPGVSVTYQGEEIGMTDYELTWEDTRDPNACQTSSTEYQKYTRDPERTPFQWDSSTYAGFTNGTIKPWLPVNSNYITVNVEAQEKAANSHLKVFKQLMKLRDSNEFHDCSYGTAVLDQNVFVILRTGPVHVHITLVNIANVSTTVNAVNLFKQFNTKSYDSLHISVATVSSKRSQGDSLPLSSIVLQPYEGLILQSGAIQMVGRLQVLFAVVVAVFLLR